MTIEHAKIFFQGALGAMTFGAYHQYTSNQIMENNNKVRDLIHKQEMKALDDKHQKDMKELENKFETKIMELQNNSRWF